MSDPRGPGWADPTPGVGGYPPNTDPAYSGYWGPTTQYPATGSPGYGVPPGYPPTQPTEQLPTYWQAGSGYPGTPPPPPEPPKKTSKWLWAAAIAAVLLVTGLVLALVIVSNSTKDSTIVAPPTSQTSQPSRTLVPPSTSTNRPPTRTAIPAPLPLPTETLVPTEPGTPPTPGATGTETVMYSVSGQGRAINITYVDTGGIMQTEFNVALPWSKEVTLAAPARTSASVAVVNIGRDVTCSVSVNGAMVRQRSGRGLTICTGAA
jgi:hypothetical protein